MAHRLSDEHLLVATAHGAAAGTMLTAVAYIVAALSIRDRRTPTLLILGATGLVLGVVVWKRTCPPAD